MSGALDQDFWDAQPIKLVPVAKTAYGRRHLGEPKFRPEPVHLEHLADHDLYLVHDGRHRIEHAKARGSTLIEARVAYLPKARLIS